MTDEEKQSQEPEEKKPRRRRRHKKAEAEAAPESSAETGAAEQAAEAGTAEPSADAANVEESGQGAAASAEEQEGEPAGPTAGEEKPEQPAESAEGTGDSPAEGAEDAEEPGAETEDGEARTRPRRDAAQTTIARPRKPARGPDGAVVVRARARYVRSAPRKARLVMEHIRGKPVEQARAILVHAPRAVSADILKLLNSAVANAESSYELGADELRVVRAFVDEGPTIKRYRPRALGRATRINKRTSHMTIELTTQEGT